MHIRQVTVILMALSLVAALAACTGGATPAGTSATATLSGPNALIGTEWVLASLQGQPLAPGTQISLCFERDRFSSFAGCNTLAGRYVAAEPGRLSLPELERTMELCPAPEGVMEQEQAYVDAFVSTATYQLSEDRLEFQDATGKAVLVYERVLPATTGSVLPGTKWVLTSLRGQPVLPGTYISLEFGDQSLSGYTGCNFYGSGRGSGPSGATGDGTFAIHSFEVTVMSCPDGIAVQEQEKAYLEALMSTVSYRLVADRLELRDATGETALIYTRQPECAEPPANLAGSGWQLLSVDSRAPAEGAKTILAFLDDQWLVEFSPCQGYISSYQASGGELCLFFTANLGQACQEGEGVTTLDSPTGSCLVQGQLEIWMATGRAFVYEPLPQGGGPPLEGTAWSLLSIVEERQVEGEPIPWPDPALLLEGSEITLTLDRGTASGSAGCNSYEGSYTLDGTALTFGPVAATEKACLTPEGVMEQEQRYLGAVNDVTGYDIYGALLWLWTEDGRALAFAAQGAK